MLFFLKFILLTIFILYYTAGLTKLKLVWIIYIEIINILVITLLLLLGIFFNDVLFFNLALSVMVLGAVEFVLFSIIYICFFMK
jgi:hypothetical protein